MPAGADNRAIEQQRGDTNATSAAPAEGRLARALALILPLEHPASAVYGLVATGSLLSVESGVKETYLDTILAAFVAAALIWLLHSYSALLGERLVDRRPIGPLILLQALRSDWPVMRGAAIPIGALVVSWIAGASQSTGVTVALWSAVGALVAFELLAALRLQSSTRELLLDVTVGVGMGAAILAIKVILH